MVDDNARVDAATASSPPTSTTVAPTTTDHEQLKGSTSATVTVSSPVPAFPNPVPSSRDVASGMVNLGNTCYVNAVMQALVHAPELCHAVDASRHRATCPVSLRNRAAAAAAARETKDENVVPTTRESTDATSKTTSKGGRGKKKSADVADSSSSTSSPPLEFCVLCEFEKHVVRAHRRDPSSLMLDVAADEDDDDETDEKKDGEDNGPLLSSNGSGAGRPSVAPRDFVRGFVENVAPWFRLGVQEDSHEFLRLLVGALQAADRESGENKENKNTNRNNNSNDDDDDDDHHDHYPLSLFRGTVESSVTCHACSATSVTVDPVEDVGLEVASTSDGRLADVSSALDAFVRRETLDGQYRCESCAATGTASKVCRLGRVPPVLTLHLKRFRYGQRGASSRAPGGSGAAKIEGHARFDQFFDAAPYTTDHATSSSTTNATKPRKRCFCRLLAVVVHVGKNVHSGHYLCYVRNLARNEWWRMDDASTVRVTTEEVVSSEAYMLFYRVVDHPVATRLKEASAEARRTQEAERERRRTRRREQRERRKQESTSPRDSKESTPAAPAINADDVHHDHDHHHDKSDGAPVRDAPRRDADDDHASTTSSSSSSFRRKRSDRPPPLFRDGAEWAAKRLRAADDEADRRRRLLARVQDRVAERIVLGPACERFLAREATTAADDADGERRRRRRRSSCADVWEADVVGGVESLRRAIRRALWRIFKDRPESLSTTGTGDAAANNDVDHKDAKEDTMNYNVPLIPVVETNDSLL